MTQYSKSERQGQLIKAGIEGSQRRSESMKNGDPRNRRAADRELGFSERYDPDLFELNANGQVTLKRTNCGNLTFQEPDVDDPNSNVVPPSRTEKLNWNDLPLADSGIRGQSANEMIYISIALNEHMHGKWIPPTDLDRARDSTLTVSFFSQNGLDEGKTVTMQLALWRYKAGDLSTKSEDVLINAVPVTLPAQNALAFAQIPIAFANYADISLLFLGLRITAASSSSALTGSRPIGLAHWSVTYPLTFGA